MFKIIGRQFGLLKTSRKKITFLYYFLYTVSFGLLPVIAIILPKLVIDQIHNNDFNQALFMIILLSAAALLLAVMAVFARSKAHIIFIAVRMREFNVLNDKFMKIDYKYLEDSTFYDKFETYTRTLSNDDTGFEGTYRKLLELFPLFITLILTFIILGMFDILIIAGTIAGGLLGILSTYLSNLYEYRKKDELSKAERRLKYFTGTSYDFAYGKDIRIYNLKDKIIANQKNKLSTYLSVFKNITGKKFLYSFLELLGLIIQDCLAYFIVIYSYFNKGLPLSDVTLYIGAIITLSTSVRTIFNHFVDLNAYTKYTRDYYSFMDSKEYYTQTGDVSRLPDTLEIEFKNVTFKYPNSEKYIFKNFSFRIKKKERLAIVGLNGSGKTTFVKLVCGLFFAESGEILINGINSKDFNMEEYAKMFSVVFQDTHLYAGTVLENVIGIKAEEDEKSKGIKAIESVGLKEKIESLPKKYDQYLLKIIESDGIELSGGQIQKLAIARALYKNGNMIILDEPTAALDALSEAEIYSDFDNLVSDKTAIYISHRLTSTKFCDNIAFFEDGKVVEYGTHEELMAKNGKYHDLFIVQGKYYQEEKDEESV